MKNIKIIMNIKIIYKRIKNEYEYKMDKNGYEFKA